MIILGVETSCDDTGIALIEKNSKGFRILSNVISSQIKIHAPYGGVVPNLAAREHLKNIEPCLKQALKQAKHPKIDLIAVTIGPGLIPSLLVGVNFAKALAYNWQKPIIGINHIEGHIYANWLSAAMTNKFPILCLVVSGGHTQLVLMKSHGKYQLLGQTRDDAAGEAFDKVAKLLNLGYPGGPIISQKAKQGNPKAFDLPRPMINSNNFDFSFSGLKTAVLHSLRSDLFDTPFCKRVYQKGLTSNMAASFQQAAIDVLIKKTIKAAKEYKVKNVMLSGGVAANQELRKQMAQSVKKELPNSNFYIPDYILCTDNAAMIATVAFHKKKPVPKQSWLQVEANANLKLIA
ncbi:MAG: tRNA (adenosine(37)-N6)-threonylcarbamoyltransferase complex transferase subunit TsaD [Parcubacteria group bacterium]|nr:tRNA (adenosine(37)-N6)-threonylcarbamoyltransferase complex transferase subunit TsaD [Parcubacteria group bacterium]